ncbi:protein of unknown function [Methylocaldum szegediense]|uniref:Uncharacterized protein n=1 Tax=Methylocaldum szegediense TaxID=73780 RepID=A0ABM9I4Y2_9GAMM|nr:protein of unknown function [Methylocaldum szegediense]
MRVRLIRNNGFIGKGWMAYSLSLGTRVDVNLENRHSGRDCRNPETKDSEAFTSISPGHRQSLPG